MTAYPNLADLDDTDQFEPEPDLEQPDRAPDTPLGGGDEGSDLDRLTAIAETDTRHTIVLPIPDVPGRSNVTLEFQAGGITGGQLQRWRKTARKRRRDADVDGFLFNALLVASTCEQIKVNGHIMRDTDGDPYNFRSVDLMQRIKATTAADAAVKFIGSEGVIGGLCGSIMEAAGFGNDIEPDPTETAGL